MIRLLNILLALIIALAPAYVYATAASGFGGWTIGTLVSDAALVTMNATRQVVVNGVSRTVTSVAKFAPSIPEIAKGIGRFGATAAVVTAIDMLLDGVDWVLDPANNRVVYHVGAVDASTLGNQVCSSHSAGPSTSQVIRTDGTIKIDCLNGSSYVVPNTTGAGQERYLSYNAIASKISSNAMAGDPVANDFIANNVANPNAWSNEEEYPLVITPIVQQLDANQHIDDKAGDNDITKTDPSHPDAPTDKFTLPSFCAWASYICNAMNISNTNSGRAATASEQTQVNTAQANTTLNTMAGELVDGTQATHDLKGEVVNGTNATKDVKGELVNLGSAVNIISQTATATKDVISSGIDSIVNNAKDVSTATKDVINTGIDKIVDASKTAADATKDVINTAIDNVINTIKDVKTEITGVKDAVTDNTKAVDKAASDARTDAQTQTDAINAVKDAVKENTANETRVADQAHADSVAQTDAITDVKKALTDDTGLPERDTTDLTDSSQFEEKKVDISFGAQCPDAVYVPISMEGISDNIPVVDYQYICKFAPIIKTAVIALASIRALFIISGRGSENG